MLKKEIRLFAFILFCLLLSQCRTSKHLSEKIDLRYKQYIGDNYHSYEFMYEIIEDTLSNWINKRLDVGKSIAFGSFQLDSLVFFNEDSSQMVTTINKRSSYKGATSNSTKTINGHKIDHKWYFFLGGTMYLPHGYYQDSIYASFTWDELGYLAYENFLGVFLRFREDGSYYINENAFEHYRTPYGSLDHMGYSNTQLDSIILANNRNIHKHVISDKEYNEIKRSIEQSVQPPEPYRNPNKKSTKIFESDAWKKRYKKKKK